MKKLFVVLALLGPIMQFVAAFVASSAVDFDRPDTGVGLPVPLYLEPGGFAFAIWPVIFIAFVLLGIYQAHPSRLDDPRWIQARPFVFLSGLGNTIWFYGDVNGMLLICTIGFIIMLFSLTKLNNVFALGEKSVSVNERWFIKFPISLFFGWITVAFPIGITLWLITDFGITGQAWLSPALWSSIILVVAGSLFAWLFWQRWVSKIFLLTGVWGFFWIYVANASSALLVGYTALAVTLLLVGELLLKRFNQVQQWSHG